MRHRIPFGAGGAPSAKRVAVAAAILFVAVGNGVWWLASPPRTSPPWAGIASRLGFPAAEAGAEGYAFFTVERATPDIYATGVVKSDRSAKISPPVSGVVRRVVPERFAAVKTGDTLVELDDRQGVENLRQERVNLEAARVQLVQAQDQLGHLQSVRERYEQLSAWGAVAAMTLEEATANVARQEHEVRLAGQRVAACEANILYLKEQAGRTRIKSPIDGIVTDVFVTKGQFVAPGGGSDQAATLLVVSDTSELFAQLLVDEIDVSRIRVGQEIELKFDALPDKRAVGRVRQIAPAPDNSQGKPGVSFETSVALETPVPEVRVGMTVFAVMRDARATPRRIPAGAVQSRGGEAWVWQEDGGRARKKAVRVRDCSGGECLLVGGLEAGAVVLAGPDARLRDMVEGTPLAAPRQGEAGHVEDHPR